MGPGFRMAVLGGAAMLMAAPAIAQPAGRVTGLGGVIVRSEAPQALAAWYKDVLGLDVKSWGGAKLSYTAPGHPPAAVWAAVPKDSGEFAPSSQPFMLNLAVDDMDAFIARLKAKGVPILKRDHDSFGQYAWILDPDGTKIELWQPA